MGLAQETQSRNGFIMWRFEMRVAHSCKLFFPGSPYRDYKQFFRVITSSVDFFFVKVKSFKIS